MSTRQHIKQAKRLVVKFGSALLTEHSSGLAHQRINAWAAEIAALKARDVQGMIVSSGSIAEGMQRLKLAERPHEIHQLQAAAAVGQMGLVQAYENAFKVHQLHAAQVLLTHDDLSSRKRYLNARSTLKALLDFGVIPVINENDTVATDEIQFGDNDTLAGFVANLVEADLLIILTDQDGLCEADPRINPAAPVIAEANADDTNLDAMVSGHTGYLGRGGMLTKLRAARIAARSGAATVIANGKIPNVIERIVAGEQVGTLLKPSLAVMAARKRWLASQLKPAGTIVLDNGAIRAITQQNRSLLPVGISRVTGHFMRGEVVLCVDETGREVARGLANYHATEAELIKGLSSTGLEAKLGFMREAEFIHRDNLVIL